MGNDDLFLVTKTKEVMNKDNFSDATWEAFKANPGLALIYGIGTGILIGIDYSIEALKKVSDDSEKEKENGPV